MGLGMTEDEILYWKMGREREREREREGERWACMEAVDHKS